MHTLAADPCASDEVICRTALTLTGNDRWAEISDAVIGTPLTLLALFALGVFVRWLLHRLVDRLVRRAEGGLPGGSGRWPRRKDAAADAAATVNRTPDAATSRRVQRAKTMGSLLKSIVTGVVVAVIATMMLDTLGVNIAPILASAGVLGLALGFGAQTLVKDFLSGIFMIVEDQYGVGDVVDLGEASGTVEAVSLRITKLRDVNGTVWYVRNGEVVRVGNQSQNWARSVLDITVTHDSDVAKVLEVLREVAHDLWEDEQFAGVIIEEPEVWGVQDLSPAGVTVRATLKTAPAEQWRVSRVMRERIKARFDEEGIEMPHAPRLV